MESIRSLFEMFLGNSVYKELCVLKEKQEVGDTY